MRPVFTISIQAVFIVKYLSPLGPSHWVYCCCLRQSQPMWHNLRLCYTWPLLNNSLYHRFAVIDLIAVALQTPPARHNFQLCYVRLLLIETLGSRNIKISSEKFPNLFLYYYHWQGLLFATRTAWMLRLSECIVKFTCALLSVSNFNRVNFIHVSCDHCSYVLYRQFL